MWFYVYNMYKLNLFSRKNLNPDACERSLASHAVYTLYSVHSYWWKRQVSHQLWPSGSQHTSKKECRWEIHSHEVQNKSNQWLHKNGHWSNKKFKKKKKKELKISILDGHMTKPLLTTSANEITAFSHMTSNSHGLNNFWLTAFDWLKFNNKARSQ